MREIGIQVSIPLIAPIRAGVKTQTRRTVKGDIPREAMRAEFAADAIRRVDKHGKLLSTRPGWAWIDRDGLRIGNGFLCPYGHVRTRLWVREAFRFAKGMDDEPPRAAGPEDRVWFEADRPHQPGAGKLRPGMFMPRWASRIDLEVLEVRVQRLQDISDHDAICEGIEPRGRFWRDYLDANAGVVCSKPRSSFASLIDSVNESGTWASNPFVFAISFRLLEDAT